MAAQDAPGPVRPADYVRPAAKSPEGRERQEDTLRRGGSDPGPQGPDRDCYTLPNGECVAESCSLHGPYPAVLAALRKVQEAEREFNLAKGELTVAVREAISR